MRIIALLIISFFVPVCVFAHPGKTDNHGGHKCWKSCGEWELEYAEYHLHDENWKPLHLDKNGQPIKHVKLRAESGASGDTEQGKISGQVNVAPETADKSRDSQKSDIKTAGREDEASGFQEEGIQQFNIIFLLLALLLLLLLLFLRKRRDKD